MRIVIAVDWSDQAFTAVQTVTRLYQPDELILVHGVDLQPFESPVFAPAMARDAYTELREAMLAAGRQCLEQASGLVPDDIGSVRRVCEVGSPARVVLDTAKKAEAHLVASGTRGRGRASELLLGSVSHRILTHSDRSTLLVKRPVDAARRILVAMETSDDGTRLRRWLTAHPFRRPVEVSVITVVPRMALMDPVPVPTLEQWQESAMRAAESSVKAAAAELSGPHYEATGRAFLGDPAAVIERESASYDLVVVGSHARSGLERFLLGSVSHDVSHQVAPPVLVIRD